MKLLILVLSVWWMANLAATADDQVRRIQEALRKRNLYFGEVDGRPTPETAGALRRFQQRQGLPATGEVSAPTLISLGIAKPVAGAVEWPEGPVLKGDAARELAEGEKQRLEELAATDPLEPIAEPPLPPDPVPAPAVDPPVVEPTAPQEFVRQYLAACATNRLPDEMRFYADRLSYFDHGMVGSDFVARDVQCFYKRWPHRHYDLLDCKISRARNGEVEAMFRIAFRYSNDKAQVAAGKSVNIFKIREDQGGLRFVSMKEQVLRD